MSRMLFQRAGMQNRAMKTGWITLFGSGETSASGRKVHEAIFQQLDKPIRAAILETPAGFELNSDRVAGRIGEFLAAKLQNYEPLVDIIPARRKGSFFSPDNEAILKPMLRANNIFLGPGSPSYAVRQLKDSKAWHYLLARHRLGAAVTFASAATVAAGAFALPIYEIYKAGHEPYWLNGLDLFGPFGLHLVFVPHWNNQEGGAELDTSHCFIGGERLEKLLDFLPPGMTVLGIDEHTALVIDMENGMAQVLGKGTVTLRRGKESPQILGHGRFPLDRLGTYHLPAPESYLPAGLWQQVLASDAEPDELIPVELPEEVSRLIEARELARRQKDWQRADQLRREIQQRGFIVADTPSGPSWEKV